LLAAIPSAVVPTMISGAAAGTYFRAVDAQAVGVVEVQAERPLGGFPGAKPKMFGSPTFRMTRLE